MNEKEIQRMYDYGAGQYASEVKKVLDFDFASGRDIEEAAGELPSSFRALRDLNKAVKVALDDTPLTVADRSALEVFAKEVERETRKSMNTAYHDALSVLEEKAKRIAIDQQYFDNDFRDLASGVKEQIFELAWAEAYERAHSDGFIAVITEFNETMGFAENVVKAIVSKGGKA